MQQSVAEQKKRQNYAAGWFSPFTAPVPAPVCAPLILLQHDRLHAMLPLACLLIAVNAIAMAIAVLGDLPYWQQLAPPVIIVGGAVAMLAWRHSWSVATDDLDAAYRRLRAALFIALILGPVAALWSVNAFTETERYYCMVAPVFIGISTLVMASCLVCVPRAAIGGMATTIAPIAIKMMSYDNLGVRAMAVMLVLITVMQAALVLVRFRETVKMLTLQHELNRLAESDALTGLDNRLAFMRTIEDRMDQGKPVIVALADLNGFKAANDTHGHLIGDEILIGVAMRMTAVAVTAVSVARLGGDEFALLYDVVDGGAQAQAQTEIAAARATIALPFACSDAAVSISTSIGMARSPDDGRDALSLLREADRRLYAEKRALRPDRVLHAVG